MSEITQVQVRLPLDLNARLTALARSQGRTRQAVVRALLEAALGGGEAVAVPVPEVSERRRKRIVTHVTASQYAAAMEHAASCDQPLSAWLRMAMLKALELPAGYPRGVRDELRRSQDAVNRIGINLNQIARALNSGGGIQASLSETLEETQVAFRDLGTQVHLARTMFGVVDGGRGG